MPVAKGEIAMTEEARRSSRLAYAFTAAALVAAVIAPYAVGLSVDYSSFLAKLMKIITGSIAVALCARAFGLHAAREAAESITILFIAALTTVILLYSAMRTNLPLADKGLANLDSSLFLNPANFVIFVNQSEILSTILHIAYASFWYQIVFIPPALALLCSPGSAYRFTSAFIMICALSSLIGAFFPCEATYRYYGLNDYNLQNIFNGFAEDFQKSFHAVRTDPNFELTA